MDIGLYRIELWYDYCIKTCPRTKELQDRTGRAMMSHRKAMTISHACRLSARAQNHCVLTMLLCDTGNVRIQLTCTVIHDDYNIRNKQCMMCGVYVVC